MVGGMGVNLFMTETDLAFDIALMLRGDALSDLSIWQCDYFFPSANIYRITGSAIVDMSVVIAEDKEQKVAKEVARVFKSMMAP